MSALLDSLILNCTVCAKPCPTPMTCGQCRRARYCGTACQRAHWVTTHKAACKRLSALPAITRPTLITPTVSPPLGVCARRSADAVRAFHRDVLAQALVAVTDELRGVGLQPGVGPTSAAARLELISTIASGFENASTSAVVASVLLAQGVSPDAVSPETGDCALRVAAGHEGCAEAVDILLQSGANPDGPSRACFPPLLAAIMTAAPTSPRIVRLLIEGGASPKMAFETGGGELCFPLLACVDDFGDLTPAQQRSRLECTRLVLAAGADLEQKEQAGRSALRYAMLQGDAALPIVLFLLSVGADPDAPCNERRRCVDVASIMPKVPALKTLTALRAHGADFTPRHYFLGGVTQSKTYLHELAESPAKLPVLQVVLDAGADANELHHEHGVLWTVLALAIRKRNAGAVRFLLRAGACPDTPSNGDVIPLQFALIVGSLDIVEVLIASGAAVCSGRDLMYQAVTSFKKDADTARAVRALLAKGLSARDASSKEGYYAPLCYAIMYSEAPEAVNVLLDAGAAPDVLYGTRASGTPKMLMLAVGGDVCGAGVVAALLAHPTTAAEARADVLHALDKRGNSMLHHASRKGHGSAVSELLSAGADANAANADGVLPLQWLERTGSKPRNRSGPRRAAYATALAELRDATTATSAVAVSPSDLESDGELNHPADLKLAATTGADGCTIV